MNQTVNIERVWISGKAKDQYLGTASVIICDGSMRFCVRGMRILDLGKPQLVLSMPSIKKIDGDGNPHFEDMFYPMNAEGRVWLEAEVMQTYKVTRQR